MSKTGALLTIFSVLLALATWAAEAPAAEAPVLRRGALVRARLAEPGFNGLTFAQSIKGRLLDLTATDLTLKTSAGRPPVVLPLQNLAGLELNVRQGRRNRGALIGGGAVLAAGFLVSLACNDDLDNSDGWQIFTDRDAVRILAVALAPVGVLVGALVAPGAKWQPIPSDRIHPGLDRGPGGESRLGATLRF